ncbi:MULTISPECIES: glycoside hydrolase family 127 protein [Acidobacterium]|uniref:Tat pathway signal sequence domain protein n=1 Tax=Acidobacterium capsulatum (strain ATCC 51196 / DSM 11244 / BCRC 80197 / JCM 7670 / NBRC 15755 / NCIMB 13165 / 161) TaxID=240015 RepID=C1F598_ACIC5|nr:MULTISPECIES: glycoside hydrolase family 127 protein [Acidobacterium]ACO34298.1 Tat pathway signal sequence domain protein [Acidobacterium capsulatum ATCC 51196]HCT59562.1 Tat pathway signal protein [Acidobacterium sp.]
MCEQSKLSRRNFLGSAAALGGLFLLPPHLKALQDAVMDIPVSADGTGYEKVLWRYKDFPMTQVRMRDGVLKNALEINRQYLYLVPNDRLLHTFRLTAGLPTSAEPLGGWEAPDCELRGHFAGGHYLSACALMYASTGDEKIKAKGDALVAELAKCQQPDGYLSAFPASFFDRLRHYQKVWAPFYTYHKIMAGHLDMYVHTGNQQALETCKRMADWAIEYTKPIPADQWQRMLLVEQGGMNEVSFNLYAVTGEKKYRDLGFRFEHKLIFDPLAKREDHLAGNHANTNIPKVIGAARGYEVADDKRYHTIAEFFWGAVTSQHAYATGGTSDGEFWHKPGTLAEHLGPAAEECCCSYNMMKLSRHLYGWTGDPRIFDYYERLMYNVRIGTQDPKGMLMYYVSLKPGYWKTFGTPFDAFWCCTGTGVEEYSKVNDSIYFHDAKNIYVNLFAGSEVQWPEKNVSLVQETNFPLEEATTLTVRAQKPSAFGLKIRVPYWATNGFTIHINGQPQSVEAKPESYATLHRTWHDGDTIKVSMPMSLHISPIPDSPDVQAVLYGPLVLAGEMGRHGLTEKQIYGDSGPFSDKENYPMPELLTASGQAGEAIERLPGGELRFATANQQQTMHLKPLYQIMDERYTVYWKVNRKTV